MSHRWKEIDTTFKKFCYKESDGVSGRSSYEINCDSVVNLFKIEVQCDEAGSLEESR